MHVQGILDVLMAQDSTSSMDESSSPAGGQLLAYRQSLSEDHTFLKVLGEYCTLYLALRLFCPHASYHYYVTFSFFPGLLVLSGHCYSDCVSEHKVSFLHLV